MSTNVRGFKWLVGGLVGVSMLGACGAPMEGETASEQVEQQAAGEIQVSLSVTKSTLSAREDVSVLVTLTNVSAQPVRLLKWYVPGGEGLKEGLFSVQRNGEAVEYIGPHFKRVAPRAEDFIVLAPGQSVSGSAPVSGLYDLSESGNYTISYSAHGLEQHSMVLTKTAQLDSNLVNLWIEGRASGQPEIQAQGTVTGQSLAYSLCSSSQQTSVSTAVNSAKTYANNTSTYLNGIASGTTRYTTWFGSYTSTRLTTARNHFTNIKNAFANSAVVVDCSCTDTGTYAYVYPASPYKIYVCGAFWSAPNTGTDSRAGTLIHEMSHFTVVAGTDDWVYGQSGAKSLAISNPTNALDNADNHEYIAENNPSLP
ncbi:M35 family metallo-endopeptidase [Archangium sp.]|uniref:M35 family metallo-endopeptidase n=1 Tax=Archangium sp. TaxID=1872627 RepID=UPI0038998117